MAPHTIIYRNARYVRADSLLSHDFELALPHNIDLMQKPAPHPLAIHRWMKAWARKAQRTGKPEHYALATRAALKSAHYSALHGMDRHALKGWHYARQLRDTLREMGHKSPLTEHIEKVLLPRARGKIDDIWGRLARRRKSVPDYMAYTG